MQRRLLTGEPEAGQVRMMEKEICAVIKGAGKTLIIMMGHGIQMM